MALHENEGKRDYIYKEVSIIIITHLYPLGVVPVQNCSLVFYCSVMKTCKTMPRGQVSFCLGNWQSTLHLQGFCFTTRGGITVHGELYVQYQEK